MKSAQRVQPIRFICLRAYAQDKKYSYNVKFSRIFFSSSDIPTNSNKKAGECHEIRLLFFSEITKSDRTRRQVEAPTSPIQMDRGPTEVRMHPDRLLARSEVIRASPVPRDQMGSPPKNWSNISQNWSFCQVASKWLSKRTNNNKAHSLCSKFSVSIELFILVSNAKKWISKQFIATAFAVSVGDGKIKGQKSIILRASRQLDIYQRAVFYDLGTANVSITPGK